MIIRYSKGKKGHRNKFSDKFSDSIIENISNIYNPENTQN